LKAYPDESLQNGSLTPGGLMTGTLLQTRNSLDGKSYRASVVELRKYVVYVTDGLLPGTKERMTVGITTEASVGRGRSFLSLMFPAFVVGYSDVLKPYMDKRAEFLLELKNFAQREFQ
jgi:hypothetical protein